MNISYFKNSFQKRLHYGVRIDPARDWLVLLTLSVIALAGIVVWNVWTFDTVASGGSIGATVTETPPIFNRSSIDAIHTIFDSRASEEAKYVTGAYHYIDPSQ